MQNIRHLYFVNVLWLEWLNDGNFAFLDVAGFAYIYFFFYFIDTSKQIFVLVT